MGRPQDSRSDILTLYNTTVSRYRRLLIVSFKDSETERLWKTGQSRRIPADVRIRAFKKLLGLHAAHTLDDLRAPPGNRLERLRGDREGQHSIRINSQYRVCFVWRDGNAHDAEIADYH